MLFDSCGFLDVFDEGCSCWQTVVFRVNLKKWLMFVLLAMNVSLTCHDQHVFLMCLWIFICIQSFSQGFVAGVFSQAHQRVDGNLWVDYFDRFRPDFDCTSGFKNMHVIFTIVHHSTMVNYPMYLRAPISYSRDGLFGNPGPNLSIQVTSWPQKKRETRRFLSMDGERRCQKCDSNCLHFGTFIRWRMVERVEGAVRM